MNFAGKQMNKSKRGALFITLSLTCKSNLRSASEDSRLDAELKYQITTPGRAKNMAKIFWLHNILPRRMFALNTAKRKFRIEIRAIEKRWKRRESFGKEARGNKAPLRIEEAFIVKKHWHGKHTEPLNIFMAEISDVWRTKAWKENV